MPQLNMNRMKRAETFRTLYAVNAEPGTKREDLLKPEYWSHVSAMFTPFDRLEVRADDGSYFAEYLIISCGRTWAKLKELAFIELSEVAEDDDLDGLEYKYRGPHAKHSVIRSADQVVLVEKLDTKDDALIWMAQHKKGLAA